MIIDDTWFSLTTVHYLFNLLDLYSSKTESLTLQRLRLFVCFMFFVINVMVILIVPRIHGNGNVC